MRDGARSYIENGFDPGSFQTAVICNDLYAAVGHADKINLSRIRDHVDFWLSEAPRSCLGSPEAMGLWKKRMRGLEKA